MPSPPESCTVHLVEPQMRAGQHEARGGHVAHAALRTTAFAPPMTMPSVPLITFRPMTRRS